MLLGMWLEVTVVTGDVAVPSASLVSRGLSITRVLWSKITHHTVCIAGNSEFNSEFAQIRRLFYRGQLAKSQLTEFTGFGSRPGYARSSCEAENVWPFDRSSTYIT